MLPFGGFSSKAIEKLLKRSGVKVDQVKAVRATIELEDGKIVEFEEPVVFIMTFQGTRLYQIMGNEIVKERPKFSEEDVKLVMEQTNCPEEAIKKALELKDGNVAEAIELLLESNCSVPSK